MSIGQRGFTLIEALIAIVIGALMFFGLGGLGERLVHHRTSTDAGSAAMSLAERKLEELLASTNLNPTAAECPTVNTLPLCAGTHTAVRMDANGSTTAAVKPFSVQWVVTDATGGATSPLVVPTPSSAAVTQVFMKQVTVTVTHVNDAAARAQVVSNFRVAYE